MKNEILAFMNLYIVINFIQSNVWKNMTESDRALIENLNKQQLKALINVNMREQNKLPPLSLGELSDCLGMKKATTSLLVSDLVDKKFLKRETDESNRRYIKITSDLKCKELGDSVKKIGAKKIEEILTHLTVTERNCLTQISDKLFKFFIDSIEVGRK